MTQAWTLVPGGSLETVPWRNGLGTSTNIVTRLHPPTSDAEGALLWQVGIAALERDAPFSHYPHMERIFTPIAGDPPPELAFHGGPFAPCPLLVPQAFGGDWPTLSRIPAPGRAFNVIVDRRSLEAAVTVLRPAAGEALTLPAAAHVVVHCLAGAITLEDQRLEAGDSLVGEGSAQGKALTPAILLVAGID